MNTLIPLCVAGGVAAWAFLRTLAGERDRLTQEADALAAAEAEKAGEAKAAKANTQL